MSDTGDMGPIVCGAVLGMLVTEYYLQGASKKQVLDVVGEIYDAVAAGGTLTICPGCNGKKFLESAECVCCSARGHLYQPHEVAG